MHRREVTGLAILIAAGVCISIQRRPTRRREVRGAGRRSSHVGEKVNYCRGPGGVKICRIRQQNGREGMLCKRARSIRRERERSGEGRGQGRSKGLSERYGSYRMR